MTLARHPHDGAAGPRLRALFAAGLIALPLAAAAQQSAPTGTAVLTWTAPRFDAAFGPATQLTGYRIWRSDSKSGPWSLIATISNPSTLSHTDTGLRSGTWHYAISTTSAAGESDLSYAATKVVP